VENVGTDGTFNFFHRSNEEMRGQTGRSPIFTVHPNSGTSRLSPVFRPYVYTPYTHPDGQPISAGIAEGAPVTETVTPQVGGTACTGAAVTGSGSLNGSGEFQDLIQLCSNAPIPACDKKYTQVIQIAGYPRTTLGVRTNTLEFTNTQVIYTSQGPTQ
jgi:hypothetical protein